MDNLKSLLDSKQYDLVLKLTETSTSSNDLFYRISAFMFLGKYEDALYVIQDHQETLESNLPALINAHINLLCVLGRFEQAYTVLDYYNNLPYQSQVVEEILRKMPKIIEAEEKKQTTYKFYSDEEIEQMLRSDKFEDVLLALDTIKNRDILSFLPILKELLVSNSKEVIKSYILMMLVKKEVDRDLVIVKKGKEIKVNPKYLIPPFIGEIFDGVIKGFDKEFKDSTLSQIATQLFSQYTIYIYPEEYPYTIKEYLAAFYLLAKDYASSMNSDLSSLSFINELDLEKINKIKEEIDKMLEEF